MSVSDLEEVIYDAWDAKTCFPPQRRLWNKEYPALGQCAVTALLVHDFFGGEIVFCSSLNHFWNVLPSGKEIDLTKSQFPNNQITVKDKVADPFIILNSEGARTFKTKERYFLLSKRVNHLLERKKQLTLAY